MSDVSKRANSDSKIGTSPSTHQFVGPGILLFGSKLLINIGSWGFLIVNFRFCLRFDGWKATAIFHLSNFGCPFTQLGLEYPLLRLSSSRPQILGTTLVLKLSATVV